MDHFSIKDNTELRNMIIVTYWAFTTLTTVGFGDYHPRSNAERALCSLILLFGVMMFSLIMGIYMEILDQIKNANSDYDDGDKLARWIGLIKKFNQGRPIKPELQNKIEAFFEYIWAKDKNQAINSDEDRVIL